MGRYRKRINLLNWKIQIKFLKLWHLIILVSPWDYKYQKNFNNRNILYLNSRIFQIIQRNWVVLIPFLASNDFNQSAQCTKKVKSFIARLNCKSSIVKSAIQIESQNQDKPIYWKTIQKNYNNKCHRARQLMPLRTIIQK